MRQIFLDTETTGLFPKEGHRIIEVGCLEMVDRRLTGNRLHFYLNPERAIDAEAAKKHGIADSFLLDKPLFKEVAAELIAFLEGAELIIHNAPFDVGFLNHELKLTRQFSKEITDYCRIVDTLVLARRKHLGQHNSLDDLCNRYHIDNSAREYHSALLDAELLAQVYLALTGGQGNLFELPQQAVSERLAPIRRLSLSRDSLRVILANDEEIKVHESFLESIREE